MTASVEPHDADAGKTAAILVYVIYLVGVFSAHLLSPIGVIVAYAVRGSAAPWVRTHLDTQIRMFWTVPAWIILAIVIGIVLIPVLVGFLVLLFGVGLVGLILTVWFAVRSGLGLVALMEGRPAP